MIVYEVTETSEQIAPDESFTLMTGMTQDVTVNDGDKVVVIFMGLFYAGPAGHKGDWRIEADGNPISIEAELREYGYSTSYSRRHVMTSVGAYEHSGAQATVTFTATFARGQFGSNFRVFNRTMIVKHITGAMEMEMYLDEATNQETAPAAWADMPDMRRSVNVENGDILEITLQGNFTVEDYSVGLLKINVQGTPITFDAEVTNNVATYDDQQVSTIIGVYERSGPRRPVTVQVQWYSAADFYVYNRQLIIQRVLA